MRAAEAAAMADGIAGAALMEAAGRGVADIAMNVWSKRPVAVLCGPGNNGGDGFVAARRLAEAGWPVRVGLLGERTDLTGDALLMANLYEGETAPLSPALLEGAQLIIDALFGTGLTRPVVGAARAVIEAANAHKAPILAVDIASGINADTGSALGVAMAVERTATFFAKKPGHLLFPGRANSGAAVDVVNIGIRPEHLSGVHPDTFENQPGLWAGNLPRHGATAHKYDRGSVFVASGPSTRTGAGRLAARGALRMGAGLVTVLSPKDALAENAAQLTAVMLAEADSAEALSGHLQGAEKYKKTCVIGPAAGVGAATRDKTLAALASRAGVVLDADALTSFADDPATLFNALRADDVLTPHAGEFARLFPNIDLAVGKLQAARAASARAGATIVLKGADSVIAAPDGLAAINVNAPPDLATAGAGDVLAGFIAGLAAQGMGGFAAACAGVWFHGACAQAVGPGLIAEDLSEAAPLVLRSFYAPPGSQFAPPTGAPPSSGGGRGAP